MGEIKISGVGTVCALQVPPIQVVGVTELCGHNTGNILFVKIIF